MKMIDVSAKPATVRRAVAKGEVRMSRESVRRIRDGLVEKGDVIAAARLAGIMAAKRTPDWVPLCHPIALTRVDVEVTPNERSGCVQITATVGTTDRTGVEMEALTAVSAAALTIYDMLKSTDRGMTFESIGLEHKSGGRSGNWDRNRPRRR
jgi:cyclic pyranopterin monophosphate synthase